MSHIPVEAGALSVRDFCQWARISEAWAWRLIAEGRLASVKRGRRRLIPIEDAKEWLAQGRAVVRLRADR